jgi:hypothetical protein
MKRRSAATPPSAMAAKATEAADTLMAWLRTQPRASEHAREGADGVSSGDQARAGGERARAGGATPTAADPVADATLAAAKVASARVGRLTPAAVSPVDVVLAPPSDPGRTDHRAPLRLAHTDWLYHRLQVTGPAAELAGLRDAAAGAGTVPWQLDLDRMAEDFFHLLVAPPACAGSLIPPARRLSLAGARIVADQLCAAVARRQALAAAQVGHRRACPFDLQALVPVPDAVLRRGPDDPIALDWLWTHWGTTQTLRHVADDATATAVLRARATEHAREGTKHAREGPAGEAAWAVSFWSADWTPWRALAQIAARWPTLRFETRPRYDTP